MIKNVKIVLLIVMIFLVKATLLSNLANCQSISSQTYRQVEVPEHTQEKLKDIYEDTIFSTNSFNGTGETNTHLEITEGLVDRLIELGKPFDYMAYPNRNHGLSEGKGTSLHLRLYMVRYLLNHLPAGPR